MPDVIQQPPRTAWRRAADRLKQVEILRAMVKRLAVSRHVEMTWLLRWADLDTTMAVCDVGCGDGYWTQVLSAHARAVIGVDPMARDLRRAHATYDRPGARFVLGVGERLPLADASVDRVMSVCVFEHCFDDRAAFREAARVLRPGGRLVATVDSLSSPRIPPKHRAWHREACYCRQTYDRTSIAAKLHEAGFEEVRSRYIMGSALGIWWEMLSERFSPAAHVMSILVGRVIRRLEERERSSGYKLLVEAIKPRAPADGRGTRS